MAENEPSAQKADEKFSRLRKLKTLAERGSPGERENAADLLEKMCLKYQISLDQIESSEEIKRRWFRFKNGFPYKSLLLQCIYKTLGKNFDSFRRGRGKTGFTKEIGVDCTTAEAMEIELDYSFFAVHLDIELKRLYDMFIQRNNLFPPNGPVSSSGKVSAEDLAMFSALKKHTRMLMIEKPKTSAIPGGE